MADKKAAHDAIARAEAALASANSKVDSNQPLIWQMWKLNKEEYLAWVHQAAVYDGREGRPSEAPLFQWRFLEPLSRTPWQAIPLVWLPVAAFFWKEYVTSGSFALLPAAACFFGGLLLWTLLEYSVHRWVFHLDDVIPDNGPSIIGHFLLHGIHHKAPMDYYRLVMPPALFAVLATVGYWLFRGVFLGTVLPSPLFHAAFGSVLVGYVCYDLTHYAEHHAGKGAARSGYLASMRKYHMKHHFSGLQNVGYGITTKLWDYVFGTVLDVNAKPPAAGVDHRSEAAIKEAIMGKDD